eukprot:scaffold1170_cov174-Amphora_coffeaeformis.AAC.5
MAPKLVNLGPAAASLPVSWRKGGLLWFSNDRRCEGMVETSSRRKEENEIGDMQQQLEPFLLPWLSSRTARYMIRGKKILPNQTMIYRGASSSQSRTEMDA